MATLEVQNAHANSGFQIISKKHPVKPKAQRSSTGEACRRPVAFVATKASLCLSRLGSGKANETFFYHWNPGTGEHGAFQRYSILIYIRTGCLVSSTVKGTKQFRFKLFFQRSTTL